MEAEPMRVLQFAKRSVVTVALISVALAGCGGDLGPDAPFNPSGSNADLDAMNATFASPTFTSFSALSVMFDAALGGSPIISHSAAALNLQSQNAEGMRAAAQRSARRISAMMAKAPAEGLSASLMAIPSAVAGRTFVYDPGSAGYVISDRPLLASNKVRFILYAVDPVTSALAEPLTETGYVDLTDLSAGSTQAARVEVVSGGVTYIDYRVSATSGNSIGRVSVIGYVSDGTTQANVNLRSTITFTAGLTLTYSLDLPQRDVSIDLTVGVSDVSQQNSPVSVTLTMSGPNGTVSMSGQFTETTGTLHIRVSGNAFATITTNGTTTTITRNDGEALTEDEFQVLEGVFELQSGAFASFDQMLAPVGALFDEQA
jgi:hypothetical protein